MTATGEIVLSGVESIPPVSYVIVRDWRVAIDCCCPLIARRYDRCRHIYGFPAGPVFRPDLEITISIAVPPTTLQACAMAGLQVIIEWSSGVNKAACREQQMRVTDDGYSGRMDAIMRVSVNSRASPAWIITMQTLWCTVVKTRKTAVIANG